jgi:hypothetical protein
MPSSLILRQGGDKKCKANFSDDFKRDDQPRAIGPGGMLVHGLLYRQAGWLAKRSLTAGLAV